MGFRYKKMHTLLIAAVMTLICIYQLYWLVGQYGELRNRLYEDIQEVLRSSDFEELVHRVDRISRMQYEGRVDVNVGYNPKDKNSFVETEISDKGEPADRHDNQVIVTPSTFGSVLKRPEDLKKVGLNMQRGIHSAIDGIKEIDFDYLDKTLTGKLRELGLDGRHQLFYLRNNNGTQNSHSSRMDTIERIRNSDFSPTDIFCLEISANSEYRMAIPQWRMAALKKMTPAILFSAFTFLLLILTFRYLVYTMRQQRLLEDIKTDFTNNITHELKTPIAIAYAANDSLLNFDSERNTPRMNRYLKACQEQLRLLDRLVEQILSLSMENRQSLILNMEEVPLREEIESVVASFKIKHPADVDFRIDVDEGLTLMTDRMHLSNIIGNLVDNAIKYSKGDVTVRLKGTRCRHAVVIEVIDNGIGIAPEQQKLVFDKFYRVPNGNIHAVKGYGLGLFYVKSMAERLGGTVSIQSVPGKGSNFILKFKQTS